jgi:hypothetical protein
VPFAGAYGWSYRNRLGTKVFQSQKAWFGGGGGFGYVTSAPFRQRATQAQWHFGGLHKSQRTSGSLKSRDVMRKVSPDQEPMQSFAVRTTSNPRPRGNDVVMAGELPVNRTPNDIESKAERTLGTPDGFLREPPNPSADVAQVAPPPVIGHEDVPTTGSLVNRTPDDIERKAERTVGTPAGFLREPSKLSADVAQVTPPPVIGYEDVSTTGSLVDRALDDLERNAVLAIGTAAGFWGRVPHPLVVLIGVVLLVALGLSEFLLRRRPVDLSWDISNFIDLKSKTPAELVSLAEENGVENASTMPRQELLFAILKQLREPNQGPADAGVTVAANPGVTATVNPSAASGVILETVFWSALFVSMAGWLYALGAGTFKLVSWLFS